MGAGDAGRIWRAGPGGVFLDGRIVSLCQCGCCRAREGAALLGEVHGEWEPAGSRVSQGGKSARGTCKARAQRDCGQAEGLGLSSECEGFGAGK